MNEHETKYEALAKVLGVDALLRLVPATPERVASALAAGDEHLNGIPLGLWDRAALGGDDASKGSVCPCCKQKLPPVNSMWSKNWPQEPLRASARLEPWKAAPGLSLGERISVLKHVAKFHFAKAVAP